jgi:hypothetical protein
MHKINFSVFLTKVLLHKNFPIYVHVEISDWDNEDVIPKILLHFVKLFFEELGHGFDSQWLRMPCFFSFPAGL